MYSLRLRARRDLTPRDEERPPRVARNRAGHFSAFTVSSSERLCFSLPRPPFLGHSELCARDGERVEDKRYLVSRGATYATDLGDKMRDGCFREKGK